jgi:hypothetical protein
VLQNLSPYLSFSDKKRYYIDSARPKLYTEHLKNYTSKLPASPNPWLEIVKFGIETNDVHATKVAYSLLQGEAWFGEFDGVSKIIYKRRSGGRGREHEIGNRNK